jgi:triosephosphate isomerase
MRSTIIAGNWKMYKDLEETRGFLGALLERLPTLPEHLRVLVCPPYTSLAVAGEMLRGSSVGLGAQDMSEHDEGAYTGEVSWKMLRSAGCEYVLLGHSERRQYHRETDEQVNRKAAKALDHGLLPVLCVGETLQEREAGATNDVVARQIRGVLRGLSSQSMSRVVIAYEPVWAIGTGRNATPAQAQEVHVLIRSLLAELYGGETARQTTIQYGGSVKPDNAAGLLGQDDIDGALVGGACLKVDSFLQILDAAMKKG